MNYKLSAGEIRELIIAKLSHNFGVTPNEATDEHYYKAVTLIVRDLLNQGRKDFMEQAEKQHKKQIYYLCMEFLMGRSLKNNLYNLGLEDSVASALSDMGIKIDTIYEQEPDAGLGNGGLGRLAACFLDGLATEGYPAMGYSLRYEYGIFRQKLVDGWQTELPDFWLPGGSVWLQGHPEKAVNVLFNGEVEESWNGSYHTVNLKNPTKIIAVPYDMMVAGKDGKGVSRLRLWAARSEEFDMKLFNGGEYLRAVEQNAMAEVITKVLYPEDNHPEGKSLRLSQQYFLVSATIQDIIHRHLRTYSSLDNLPELVAIHLNDTHPVLAIPELMRVILDECGYTWDAAWDIVTRTVSYTNHTVMPEALECWDQEMFRRRLPRIYQIIEEINRRFCAQMHDLGVDGYQVGRMAVLNEGIVRMANLAVAAGHSVNGVSRLHSEILKETVFHDFYTVMPYKFKNVTNGIAHRRWLCYSNPELSGLIRECIGEDFRKDPQCLSDFKKFGEDSSVLDRLTEIKLHNKQRFAEWLSRTKGISIDTSSIFDVQVKRIHEYKRQTLNILKIIAYYNELLENPNADIAPCTFIFGGKAAPGYYLAKDIIKLIWSLGEEISHNSRVRDKIKVIFLEDYNVSAAEILIPASDISEQISLAGKEASGTGCMKFMINGALTIGTLDGANVEMRNAVGRDNIYIFGLDAHEVDEIWKAGYDSGVYYRKSQALAGVMNTLRGGFAGSRFSNLVNYFMYSHGISDPYMCFADFESYMNVSSKIRADYENKIEWQKKALYNIAGAGFFSSDRSIVDYAENIWEIYPVN